MPRYYIQNTDQLEGPYSLANLKQKQIKKDTMIWTEGQGDWRPAGKIKELNTLFSPIPLIHLFKAVLSKKKH